MARVYRAVLAESCRIDATGIDAKSDEVLAQSQRASFTQRAIIFLGASFIAMAFDFDGVGRVCFEVLRYRGDIRLLRRFHHRTVKIEVDGVGLKNVRIGDPAIVPRAGKGNAATVIGLGHGWLVSIDGLATRIIGGIVRPAARDARQISRLLAATAARQGQDQSKD